MKVFKARSLAAWLLLATGGWHGLHPRHPFICCMYHMMMRCVPAHPLRCWSRMLCVGLLLLQSTQTSEAAVFSGENAPGIPLDSSKREPSSSIARAITKEKEREKHLPFSIRPSWVAMLEASAGDACYNCCAYGSCTAGMQCCGCNELCYCCDSWKTCSGIAPNITCQPPHDVQKAPRKVLPSKLEVGRNIRGRQNNMTAVKRRDNDSSIVERASPAQGAESIGRGTARDGAERPLNVAMS